MEENYAIQTRTSPDALPKADDINSMKINNTMSSEFHQSLFEINTNNQQPEDNLPTVELNNENIEKKIDNIDNGIDDNSIKPTNYNADDDDGLTEGRCFQAIGSLSFEHDDLQELWRKQLDCNWSSCVVPSVNVYYRDNDDDNNVVDCHFHFTTAW
ncbi:hypothetical protein PV326_003291 [Microctonus aethiopoides]|nr:hypothetical protein PV326_003291 [Microctonus aethiopoides]